MAPRSSKNNKKTKNSRTRRQRQRRRQMRGGGFLDLFRPTKKDAEYCQKQYDECNANIKPDSESVEDDDSSFYPSFLTNFFGKKKDSTASKEEVEGEDEGIEMQEIPGTEQPVIDDYATTPVEPAIVPPAKPVIDDYAIPPAKPVIVPPEKPIIDVNAIPLAKPVIDAYAIPPAKPMIDVNAYTEDAQDSRLLQPIPPNKPPISAVAAGGGSRKKYKKRNANRSRKNRNRRNKKITNKRN